MDRSAMMREAQKLFTEVDDLPTIPTIVINVTSLLDNVDSDPAQIADMILSDQVLAARVIKVINSPLCRTTNKIPSVKQALLFIGFKKIREMILTSYFVGGFSQKEQSFDIQRFWIHSFSVGAISRRIAHLVGYPDLEKAYLAGILHDIGKVFLGHYCHEEYGRMLAGITNSSVTTHEAECRTFGTTHCEIGLCLAQRWNFPSVYGEVISFHHKVEMATEDVFLTSIVAIADFYCLSHYTAHPVAQASVPGVSEEYSWHTLVEKSPDLKSSGLEHFLSDLDEEYEAICIEVAVLFSSIVND